MGKFIDLTGKKFDRLTVISRAKNTRNGVPQWLCLCSCHKYKIIRGGDLRSGATQSCGCLHKERLQSRVTTHGRTKTFEHRVWTGMKTRCQNIRATGYRFYGGRGITVCDRWDNSFEAFLEDMGVSPSEAHSIDRINSNGNYEPNNCRWATLVEQRQNQRGVVNIICEATGVTKCSA